MRLKTGFYNKQIDIPPLIDKQSFIVFQRKKAIHYTDCLFDYCTFYPAYLNGTGRSPFVPKWLPVKAPEKLLRQYQAPPRKTAMSARPSPS